jgi:hypothetical protein
MVTPIVPATQEPEAKGQQFRFSLGNIVRPSLKEEKVSVKDAHVLIPGTCECHKHFVKTFLM